MASSRLSLRVRCYGKSLHCWGIYASILFIFLCPHACTVQTADGHSQHLCRVGIIYSLCSSPSYLIMRGSGCIIDLPLRHKYPTYTAAHAVKYQDSLFWLHKSVDWIRCGKKNYIEVKVLTPSSNFRVFKSTSDELCRNFCHFYTSAERTKMAIHSICLCTPLKGLKPALTHLFGHLGAAESSWGHTLTYHHPLSWKCELYCRLLLTWVSFISKNISLKWCAAFVCCQGRELGNKL